MGFWEAVRWWEEWQLRILVLTSLFLQCFLFFAGILRKLCIPSWLRFLIWLAYLGSDAVAIYGLATLFNRQRTQEWVSTHESSARLQVLWAPILLVHLGGQNGITAYNIEDNELWRRHVLTAVSQVAVAVYVFRNSWPQDKRIFAAGVLLFVVGILKCILKPWELKRASINSLVDSSAGLEKNRNVSSLHEYIRAATQKFQDEGHGGQQSRTNQEGNNNSVWKWWEPNDLFMYLPFPYSSRLSCLKTMVHHPDEAHVLLGSVLSATFDRLYTKKPFPFLVDMSATEKVIFLRAILTMLATTMDTSIILKDHAEGYDRTDVEITLILIWLATVLDIVLPFVIGIIQVIREPFTIRKEMWPDQVVYSQMELLPVLWPDQVAQYNLIGYIIRNKKHRKLRRIATLLVSKEYIDQLWCMKPSKSSNDITRVVHNYIAKGWTEHHIKDMATYRAFNDNRGQWTLKQEGCNHSFDWGLRRPFDESVLLWHLATDFCFLHMDPSLARTRTAAYKAARRSKEISNYMVYLLFVNPEMLMTGARRSLFKAMYKGLKGIPLSNEPVPQGQEEKQLAQNIIHSLVGTEGSHMDRMVHDAWAIASELLTGLQSDDEKLWRVVQGVWVEMLCFSAGRCRGYLHAKSLGKGGEFLSYVWLLLFYMGMETVDEKMQRSELQEETDEGGLAVDPRNN